MKVFTCIDFRGLHPVGTAAVIVAPTKERAYDILSMKLTKVGLQQDGFTLDEVDTANEGVDLLCDGDY